MAGRIIVCADCGQTVTVDGRAKKRTLCDSCHKKRNMKNLGIELKTPGRYKDAPIKKGQTRCGHCKKPVNITKENKDFKRTFCSKACIQAYWARLHFQYRTKKTVMTKQRREWLMNMGVRVRV